MDERPDTMKEASRSKLGPGYAHYGMTPEESDTFEQKMWSMRDGVAYGGVSIEDAVFQLLQLVKQARKKMQIACDTNHEKEYAGSIALAL
jgi:hypothetical protein